MARGLMRLGVLALVASVVYLAAAQVITGGVDTEKFRWLAGGGAVSLALGFVLSIVFRGAAAIAGRSCPRCGRRVTRGRVYCDEHLQETINEYRDEQTRRG